MNSELYHHGILGMKWGVRRYQNYDGSYTRKGLARYNKAKTQYDSARAKKKSARKDLLSGNTTFAQYRKVSNTTRGARKELNNAYANLKRENLADQGKRLYGSGKTISGNFKKYAIAEVAIAAGSNFVSSFLAQQGKTYASAIAANTIAIGGTAVNAFIAAKTYRDNKRIRAYYAHRS